jgi:hypothetical protein
VISCVKDLLCQGRRPVGQVRINDVEGGGRRLYNPVDTRTESYFSKHVNRAGRYTLPD